MTAHPRVIQSRMVGDEIEQEPRSSSPQLLPQPRQGPAAAEFRRYGVFPDREGRTAYICVLEVRQNGSVFLTPFWLAERNRSAFFSGLPHTEQPNPIETEICNLIECRIGNIVERSGPPEG